MSEMLQNLRDAAEKELYKYKQDAEEMFSKNVSWFYCSLNELQMIVNSGMNFAEMNNWMQ